MENVLSSWRQCALSFKGRALVINALALSRVWYVASLIHMLPWVLSELYKLVFGFFWKGKRDLVSRSVVVQPLCFGGFSAVDVKLKVWSLVAQWIRRLASSSSWVSFLDFWCFSVYNESTLSVLSHPFSHSPIALPPSIVLSFLPGVP